MAEEFFSRKIDPASIPAQPDNWIWMSFTDSFSMPYQQVQDLQLAALKTRFTQMVDRIEILGNLAESQGVSEIRSLDDGALLLFPHSIYKSYPISFLEKAQFDRLTQWLGMLTVDDLSGLDASGIDSIDDWIVFLDTHSDIRVVHSTGTTGKLSLLPRSAREYPIQLRGWRQNFHGFGDEPAAREVEGISKLPIVFNGYRAGGLGHFRLIGAMMQYFFDGDESMIYTRHRGRMSADALSLGGRLMAAAQRGDAGRIELSDKLRQRRAQFIEDQEKAEQHGREFMDRLVSELRGRRIQMMGNWLYQYGAAREGLARGVKGVFARDSLIHTAGGTKGQTLPEGFQDVCREFLGVDRICESYGMSEMIAMLPKCPQGKHHISPWVIPYLLEPKTGAVLPRSGTQTGRFGFVDLAPFTTWGGMLSGDKITIEWDGQCPCGRIGPRALAEVARYSEAEGGDDKITCAGAPDAHDKALDYIRNAI